MHKRVFMTSAVAVVVGIAIPVQAAVAKPVAGQTIAQGYAQPYGQQSVPLMSERSAAMNPRLELSAPLVSERSAAMNPRLEWSAPLVSERSAAMNPQSEPSVALVSDKLPGLHHPLSAPSTAVLASTNNGFDWGDAGIGGAAIFATMLVALGGAAVLRRHYGHPAH
jgi:hypothetical protein